MIIRRKEGRKMDGNGRNVALKEIWTGGLCGEVQFSQSRRRHPQLCRKQKFKSDSQAQAVTSSHLQRSDSYPPLLQTRPTESWARRKRKIQDSQDLWEN